MRGPAARLLDVRTVGVGLLTAALAGAALALVLGPLSGGSAPGAYVLPWWTLVPLFAATEVLVVYVQVRREATAVSFAELPIVLGLAFVEPVGFVLASVLGSALGLVLQRRWGLKMVFNVAMFALEGALAMAVYRALSDGASPDQFVGMVSVLATIVLIDLVSAAAITAVIGISSGNFDSSLLRESLTTGLIAALTNASVALLAVLALRHEPGALLLLVAVVSTLFLCYRGYSSLSSGHSRLQLLYQFTRGVGGATQTAQVAADVLREVRDVLGAETSELVLPAADGRPGRHLRLAGGQVEEVQEPADWWAPALRGQPVLVSREDDATLPVRNGLAAPMVLEGDLPGVLIVADRPRHLDDFTPAELPLVAALANHAAVALENARLVDRLRQEAAEKEHQALHDTLTDLPNRRGFLQHVDAVLQQPGAEHCVALVGLDGFQDINEALGFETGDLLLLETGRRLAEQVPEAVFVARLGGDEFAVLLPGASDDASAVRLARAVTAPLSSPFAVRGLGIDVRASVGVVRAPLHGTVAATLLQRAEVAMYVAKRDGSGVEVFDPLSDHGSARRLQLTAALRAAVADRQLEVHYQPKVDPATGVVLGAEALVRWRHARLGPISPDEFIPLAEYTGLIGPLTTYVLETALAECRRWRASGRPLSVAVNLSARSLTDLGLPAHVDRLLAAAGLPAAALTLEITESVVMSDPERALRVLEELRSLGVRLSVDDFGTGMSSLAYLKRLPVHEVKIDKSFVTGMLNDAGDSAIVHAAIRLVHDLGLRVVAEGVEDVPTQRQLAAWDCDTVQGYLLSRPIPAATFRDWLAVHEAQLQTPAVALAATA